MGAVASGRACNGRWVQGGGLILAVLALAGCQGQAPAPAAGTGAGEAMNAAAEAVKAPAAEAATAMSAAVPAADTLPAGVQLGSRAFQDRLTGLRLDAPAGMTWHRDLHPHYLTAPGWTAFAPADQPGTALAALRLDGSNEVTAAELRIGRSDDAQVLTACTEPPAEAVGAAEPVELDGVTFLHYHAEDAAMSHYLQVDGYRGLRESQCVAIDLVVSGTRPEVYDPPRRPPFTVEQAQARLREALAAIRWETAPAGPASAR